MPFFKVDVKTPLNVCVEMREREGESCCILTGTQRDEIKLQQALANYLT